MEKAYTGRIVFPRFAANCLVLLAIVALLPAPAFAQFVSGSNGSDGSITFNLPPGQTSFTYDFNPRTICAQAGVVCSLGTGAELDPDGDNIYHFSTVTICCNSSVIVRLRASQLSHTGPVVWLATGNVVIGGLYLNGANGHSGGQTTTVRGPSEPGPGGFPGGAGAKVGDVAQRGAGPGGAAIANNASYGCSAGHVSASNSGARCVGGGGVYGTTLIQPLVGGSGGSGGHYSGNHQGAGGGAGGGAIRISSSGTITITGNGMNVTGGAPGGPVSGYHGGAGSAGVIHLQARSVTMNVPCGGCGLRADATNAFNLGGIGNDFSGEGRIRIDADTYVQGNATVTPVPLVGPATANGQSIDVPLPTAPSAVRVVSIAGVQAPANPANQYTVPDIAFSTQSAVTLEVEAHNIPVGTVLRLHITSEGNGAVSADQVVNSTALAGTFATSTASATVTMPQGVSRFYVRATW